MTTRKIEILGTGCSKCKALESAARDAVARLGLDAEVVKIERIDEIVQRGVLLTPAIAIDGVIKASGKVLAASEIEKLLAS